MLQGITLEIFARYPVVNSFQVMINHSVPVFGHLALYPALMAEMTGMSNMGIDIPASYPDLFKMGVPCQDDPTGTTYPAMDDIGNAFFLETDALIATLDSMLPTC